MLYPAPLRDVLIELAYTKLFRAKWSQDIQDEWTRNLSKKNASIEPEKLARTCELMNRAVPDCLVEGYEPLIDCIDLPDQGDRHVLAAAIRAGADAIVTANLKHFPKEKVELFDIEVLHPDDFISYQFDLSQAKVITAIKTVRERLKKPSFTGEQYLEMLERQSLPKTVDDLRPFVRVI